MARSHKRPLLRFETLEDRLTPATVPLDPTFGTGGTATLPLSPRDPAPDFSYTQISKIAAAPNGGVYALAWTSFYPFTQIDLVRLNAQGNLDTSFDGDGRAQIAGFTTQERSFDFVDLAVQADGKVVVLGTVTEPYLPVEVNNQQSDIVVRRFNPDGSLDTTFGTGGTATVGFDAAFPDGTFDTATALAIGADGRIVVLGRVSDRIRSSYVDPVTGRETVNYYTGGNLRIGVARLTTGGQFDPSFDTDGRALIGLEEGFFDSFTTPTPTGATRFLQVNDVAVAPDGGIVLAGSASQSYPIMYPVDTVPLVPPPSFVPPPPYSYPQLHAFAARLTPGGALEPAFDGDGIRGLELGVPPQNPTDRVDYSESLNQDAKWINILADGHVIVGMIDRTLPVTRFAAFRLNADSTTDTGYGANGVATTADGWGFSDMGVAADGRVFVLTGTDTNRASNGAVTAYTSAVSSFTPSGVFDQRYGDSGRQQLPVGTTDNPVTPTGMIVAPSGQVTVGVRATQPGPHTTTLTDELFVRYAAEPGLVGGVYVSAPGGAVAIYQTGSDGKLYLNTGAVTPFPGFTGTVRMTTADLNGDGTLDTIYAMGTGGSQVRVELGLPPNVQTFAPTTPIVFDAYEASFQGGIFIAAGDIDGDGQAELVTSPNDGGSARVQVFRLVNNAFVTVDNFFAIEDPAYRGGGRVALGDLNADGNLDLIVGAGRGGSTRTAIYDGLGLQRGTAAPPKLMGDFFAIPDTINLRDGVYVAAGDLNSDGRAELIVGSGTGGGPRLLVLDSTSLLASRDVSASVVGTFFVDDVTARAGARVAVRDTNGDGKLDLIATGGAGTRNSVRVYTGPSIWAAHGSEPPTAQVIDWTGDTGPNGVFVG